MAARRRVRRGMPMPRPILRGVVLVGEVLVGEVVEVEESESE